jgi:hypothetical protein
LVTPYGPPDNVDVTAAREMSLGTRICPSTLNIAGVGVCNVVLVQRVINASLGRPCSTPTNHGVLLEWLASPSPNLAGYYIYRATTSGGSYTRLNATPLNALSYDDTAVQAGQTYYYQFTAVDNNGVESVRTVLISATIPSP